MSFIFPSIATPLLNRSIQLDFRNLVRALPEPCLVLSPDLTILEASDAFERASMRERAQLVGRPILEVFPEEHGQDAIAQLRASLQQVRDTRQHHQIDRVRYDLPDAVSGSPKPQHWQCRNSPVLDEQGELRYIIHQSREVTEQLKSEAHWQASQEQEKQRRDETKQHLNLLQTLLDQAPVAMALFQGDDLKVTSANHLICNLWGHPLEKVIGRPLLEAVPELKGQGFEALIQEVLVTGVPYGGQETPVQLLRDGQLETTYYNFICHPLSNEQEEIVGVVNVAVEVTEQVKARQRMDLARQKEQALNEALAATNEELRATNDELESSRRILEQFNSALEERVALRTDQVKKQVQTFDATLAALQDFVYTFDPQGRFTYANQRLLDLLQTSLNEIVGKSFDELPYPAELAERLAKHVAQVITTGQSLTDETPYTDPSGHAGYYEYIFRPIFNPQQEVIAVAGSTRDITHRKQSEQRLRLKNEELTRTNTDLDNFIYTASHDLKAPISNIEALLAALLRTLPSNILEDDRTQRITGMMQQSVERFKRTIGNLTEVVKLQKDNSEASVEINLAEVVQEVRLDLEPLIRSSGVQLTVDLADCPAVYFSKKNLRSVVYNLLSNAIKYRSSERVPTVLICSRRAATHDLLTITDNGLGMDLERRDQLFGMFKRFHDHVEGTGIGLYMVKKIVENAGGKIEVSSALDKGSTFRVYFKRQETTADA